jgi:peroxiredoxin
MRILLTAILAAGLVASGWSQEAPKQAPQIVLQSPDGKKSYDLAKLVEKGPVLVRLTCACTGCDAELPFFQKLQAAYNNKLQTVAVFRETPEALESYASKNGLNFMYLADPKGAMWKTFDAKAMPTNILIDKGGKVVRIVPGCTKDGKNAQTLSNEVAKLLQVPAAQITEAAKK